MRCWLVFWLLTFTGITLAQCTLPRTALPADMPPEVRRAVEGLYSPDRVTRVTAAYTVGQGGPAAVSAIPFLVNLLPDHGGMNDYKLVYWAAPDAPWADEITSPGREAAKALVRIGLPAVDPLLAALKTMPELPGRVNAMYALGCFRDKRAVPLLTDHANIWQAEALIALGNIGDPACIPRLMTTFNQHDGYVSQVVDVLVRLGAPSVDPLLAHLANPKNPGRAQAILALARLGDARAVTPLIDCGKEADPVIQLAAGTALLAFPPDPARLAPVMLPLLKSPDWRIRQRAAQHLGRCKDARLLPALLPLLADPDVTVRGYAARAVGELGAPGAGDAVAPLLQDRNRFPRKAALEALVRLKDLRAIPGITALVRESDAMGKLDAVDMLARLGSAEAAGVLAPLTSVEDAPVREAAQRAILAIGVPAAEPYAAYLGTQGDKIEWKILGTCADTLAALGPPAAVPAARAFIAGGSWQYALRMRPHLPALGDGIIAPIVAGMHGKEHDWPLMERGTDVLAALTSRRVVAPLIALLDHKDAKVSDRALAGLQKVTGQQLGKDAAAWRAWLANNPQ
jgi:HEAT repeat protein